MVLKIEVKSEHVAHAWRKIGLLRQKRGFVPALELIKCAPLSELPSIKARADSISKIPSSISTLLFIWLFEKENVFVE